MALAIDSGARDHVTYRFPSEPAFAKARFALHQNAFCATETDYIDAVVAADTRVRRAIYRPARQTAKLRM